MNVLEVITKVLFFNLNVKCQNQNIAVKYLRRHKIMNRRNSLFIMKSLFPPSSLLNLSVLESSLESIDYEPFNCSSFEGE